MYMVQSEESFATWCLHASVMVRIKRPKYKAAQSGEGFSSSEIQEVFWNCIDAELR
jgi:hypothetical protein